MADQIVIQFSSSTAWQSEVIRLMCHGPFSHADLVLEDGNLLGASDQGPDSPCIKGNPQGVAIRPPDYQEFNIRRNAVLATPKADAITAAWMSQLGKPFDSEALHSFMDDSVFSRNWRDKEKWFCMEGLAWSMETGGYWEPDVLLWPKSRMSPMDFLAIIQFDPRWVNKMQFWEHIPHLALGKGER